MKAYSNFSDKFGNSYGFDNYVDFAQFWFNLPFAYASKVFPEFTKLQKAASTSKEARKKL